jgi:hypothetical protein
MKSNNRNKNQYLFWCYMNHGGEAWFEVAPDRKTARENFAH